MAVSALNKICGTTMEVTESKYDTLISEREQLRILKNYTRLESEIEKADIIKLINAMEVDNG